MSSMDERGKGIETKFFHDTETEFKIISRRRKLLGLWAADQMNYDNEKSEEYALDVVAFGVENNEDGAVVNYILKDLTDAGIDVDESSVREKMAQLHETATEQITS